MNRVLNFLSGLKYAALICCLIIAATTTAHAQFQSGSGTEGDPYIISTAAQLAQLATYVNDATAPYANAGVHYKLGANIDLADYGEGFNDGEGWITTSL